MPNKDNVMLCLSFITPLSHDRYKVNGLVSTINNK